MRARFKWFLFLMILVSILPLNVRADCDYQRLADLSKMASNVQFSYNYDLNEAGVPVLTYYINNVTTDIYVEDRGGVIYSNLENVTSYPFSANLEFTIYSRDPNCYGEKVLTVNKKVPPLNKFYNSDKCYNKAIKLCEIWCDTSSYTYPEFKDAVDALEVKNEEKKVISDKTNDNSLLFVGIEAILVILTVLVILLYRKKRYL